MSNPTELAEVIELPVLSNEALGFVSDPYVEYLDDAKAIEPLLWARSSQEAFAERADDDVQHNLRQGILTDFHDAVKKVAGCAVAGRASHQEAGREAARVYLNLLKRNLDEGCRNILYGDDFKTFIELSLDAAGLIPAATVEGSLDKQAVKERGAVEKSIRVAMYATLDAIHKNSSNALYPLLQAGKWSSPSKGTIPSNPFDKENGAIIRFNYKEPDGVLSKVEIVVTGIETRMPQSLSSMNATSIVGKLDKLATRIEHIRVMCDAIIAETTDAVTESGQVERDQAAV